MIATTLSVVVMVLSVSITEGFKDSIRQKLYHFWGHVLLTPFNENPANILAPKPIKLSAEVLNTIKENNNVSWASPIIVRPAIVQNNGTMEGLRLKGIDASYQLTQSLNIHGSVIKFNDTSYAKEIILSQATAKKLMAKVGDDLLLYFLDSGADLPLIRKLRLVGTYHTGMEDIDQYLAICDMRLLQHINRWQQNDINGYQIMLKDFHKESLVADYLFNHTELSPQTITDTFPGIVDWLNVQSLSIKILLVIMAIVAIISIGAALLILIVERASITGLLKTIGLNSSSAQMIFIYIALLISIVSIVLGDIIALTLCWLQQNYKLVKLNEATYFMKEVPIKIDVNAIIFINIATIITTLLFMWLPTLIVRRMLPAKMLRFK